MLSSSDNGRSALNCHPPTPDTVIGGRTSQKFTGQVRDAESRLDYFGRRYYSAPQGRFLTVDPTMRSAWGEAPQTWNRYSYGLNRPLSTVDPDGGLPFLIALPAAVGAVAGTVSAGTNLWVQHRQGGAINFRDVAAAGAGGFVAGFVGTAAFPALATSSIGAAVGAGTIRQLLPAIVAGGAGNGIGGITERILDSKSNTLLQHAGNIGLDAIVGGAAGIGSFGLKPAFNNMGKDLFAMPIRLRNYPSYSAFSSLNFQPVYVEK